MHPGATKTPQTGDSTNLFKLQVAPSATNPISQLDDFKMDSKDVEKPPDQSEFSLAPGVLRDKQLCNFAYQIANGLKHLANINVRLLLMKL